jgi:hypothetical protein
MNAFARSSFHKSNQKGKMMAITIQQLANYRLGKEATTGEDFQKARLPMLGGCEICHATVACYNSCPSHSGNIRCDDCIGDDGWDTVEEANMDIFMEDFYAVYDLNDDSHHGTYLTLDEARGCVAFDKLEAWAIWHKNERVEACDPYTGDDERAKQGLGEPNASEAEDQ